MDGGGEAAALPATPRSTAAESNSTSSTPTSTPGHRKTPRTPEPHISVLDADELAIARRWAATALKEKTGVDVLAPPGSATSITPATTPTAGAAAQPGSPGGSPSTPSRGDAPVSTLSTLFRKMLSPATSPSAGSGGGGSGGSSPSSPTQPHGQGAGAAVPPGGTRLLGVPLEEMIERAPAVTGAYRLRLPAQMHEMLKFLRKAGRVDLDGVFRISGSAKHIEELQALFIANPHLDLETVQLKSGIVTTHDVAALLKLFVRSLPEPLITAHFERLCPAVQQLESGQERIHVLQLFYISLPPSNRDCFESLVRFLHRVAREKNKMNATNLALIFAPALLTTAAQANLQLHHHVVAVLKTVISRYDEIFKPTAWLAVRDETLRAYATKGAANAYESSDESRPAAAAAAAVVPTLTNPTKLAAGAPPPRSRSGMLSGFFTSRRGLRRANTLTPASASSSSSGSAATATSSSASGGSGGSGSGSVGIAAGPGAAAQADRSSNTSSTATADTAAAAAAVPAIADSSVVRSASASERRRRKAPLPAAVNTTTAAPPAAVPAAAATSPTTVESRARRSVSDNHLLARSLQDADDAEPDVSLISPTAARSWSEDMLSALAAVSESLPASPTTGSSPPVGRTSPSALTPLPTDNNGGTGETLLQRRRSAGQQRAQPAKDSSGAGGDLTVKVAPITASRSAEEPPSKQSGPSEQQPPGKRRRHRDRAIDVTGTASAPALRSPLRHVESADPPS